MSKRWTVGSLIPGKETRFTPEKAVVYQPESKAGQTEKATSARPSVSVIEIKQGKLACSVSVKPGAVLLDAAIEQGCSLTFKCRKGTCGACTVEVLAGHEFLSNRNEAEEKKLGSSAKRLACQAVIK